MYSRESEGSFQYGNYYREVEDLRAVVQHFREEKYVITTIVGHSKGQITVMHLHLFLETEFSNGMNRQLISLGFLTQLLRDISMTV